MNLTHVRRATNTALVFAACFLMGTSSAGLTQGLTTTVAATPPESRAAAAPQQPGAPSADAYEGTPVGYTPDGYPFRGNPGAPITLVEYSDFLCPFCGLYFRDTMPKLVDKYVRTGKVRLVLHDFPIPSLHPTAAKGAIAAMCVGEQGAARYWRMHDRLVGGQQQWNRLPDPGAFLADAAKSIGADMPAYERCVALPANESRLQQRIAAGQALGFTGTPTFQFMRTGNDKAYTLIGAQPVDIFERWIDLLLDGKEPPEAKAPEKRELPAWAKAEGLIPDPKRPGYTKAGDPYKGNPNAKLVLVEFGDFECPACQRHALTAQPALDKQFVESGDIMWVVKSFPLRMHPNAPIAAAAAACAGAQDKFWLMHHALYERMEQWSKAADMDKALIRIAADIGLNKNKFGTCLGSRKPMERVLRDLYDGQGINVKNIPTFVVLRGDTASVMVGARSASDFAATLRQQVEQAKEATSTAQISAKR